MKVTFQERKEFTFVSKGLPADTFAVVRFKGIEAISRPYVYDITLASDDPDIDLKAVLSNPATLTVTRGGEDFPVHGRVARFDQMHEVKQHVFYRAVLVPRLWNMGLARGNRLFLDKNVKEVIEQMLKQAGLTTKDYELKLKKYPQWEYICQYRESDLDFLTRWMEREGIFFFFEQTEQGEKLIVADDKSSHPDVPGEKKLSYSPPSALIPAKGDVVTAFLCRQAALPNKVVLKDYDYENPTLEVKGEATVDPEGTGEVYLYGEHFKTPEVGNSLAKVRAEELLCREKVFQGEATAPGMSPGFAFELAGHYRDDCNQKYLLTEVEHEGFQTGEFLAGLEGEAAAGEETPSFTSRFSCIPSSVPFRPERKTPKPRFYGTMNAVVDAEGDGSHAELDNKGRYKVILPFDLSGNKDGKASHRIRMAQPYSGPEYGTHFPLHKGAEVLLTFIDGDPDRPVISGAVPNKDTQSPVTSANQTKSVIRDNFGNEIVMDATPGEEHIRIHSPRNNSGIEMGRQGVLQWTGSDENSIKIGNTFEAGVGMSTSANVGTVSEVQLGLLSSLTWGLGVNFVSGGSYNWNNSWDSTYTKGPITTYTVKDILTISGDDHVLGADDKVCIIGGAGRKGDGRSIVNVYPGSLVLSTGGKSVQELSSGSVFPGSLYDDKIPRPVRSSLFGAYALNWADRCMVTIAMLSALVPAGIGIFTDVKDQPEAEKETNWIPVWTGIITALLAIFYAEIKKHKEFEKAEPVEHTDPAAKLQMTKDGEVIISSTGGQSKRRIDLRLYGSPQPRTGPADYPETGLSMDKDGARLFSGDKKGSRNKSRIHISKKSGTILISNSKSNGMIKVFSKDKVVLDSKKQINLQTGKIFSRKGSLHLRNLVAKA